MSKRIIFCADGTWDSPPSITNVYKLYKGIATNSNQFPFYDDGVGVDGNPIEKLLGGAFGEGLFQKIIDGYTKIAHVYEEGDDIFLFGFSRGAYTVRSLAGMIGICGLPTKSFDDSLINTAFRAYRERTNRAELLASLKSNNMFAAKIKMVGVWDTVGSLGIPALFGGISHFIYGFLDTGLNPSILNAYHALSIDEKRREFPPTLWTSEPAAGQVIEQIWFCGVHSDVGGGYPETGLSDITLVWLGQKALALGLEFVDNFWAPNGNVDEKNALAKIHESWTLLWGIPMPRNIPKNAAVANSVSSRCANDNSYRPNNLNLINNGLADSYLIVPVM